MSPEVARFARGIRAEPSGLCLPAAGTVNITVNDSPARIQYVQATGYIGRSFSQTMCVQGFLKGRDAVRPDRSTVVGKRAHICIFPRKGALYHHPSRANDAPKFLKSSDHGWGKVQKACAPCNPADSLPHSSPASGLPTPGHPNFPGLDASSRATTPFSWGS